MIEPTERALWLLVVVGIVGGLGIALPAVGLLAPFALAGLLAFVVVDTILAGAPQQVAVQRVLPARCVEGRPADFAVRVSRHAAHGRRGDVDVEVTDALPGADDPWLTGRARLGGDDVVTLRARRTFARRGRHPTGRIAIRTLGPLGLIRRRERRVVNDEVRVAVDLGVVVDDAARLVRSAADGGARRRRAVESGRELHGLRGYRRGDDARLVDWKATARAGALIVKELVPETRQDVVVVLDAGRQLCGRQLREPQATATAARSDVVAESGVGEVERFVLAERTALVLSAAALHEGDRAGLLALADDVVAFVPPLGGRAQLKRIADATAGVDAVAIEPPYARLPAFLGARLSRRALIVVVTDVVDEASARALALGDPALRRLATSAPDEDDPLGARVPAAAQRLLQHRTRALAALRAVDAIVVDVPADRADVAAVDAYLAIKARGQL